MGIDDYLGKGMMKSLEALEAAQRPSRVTEFAVPQLRLATHADTMFEQIIDSMRSFQVELAADEELGAQVANFGTRMTIAIDAVSYDNPFLIKLHGKTENGDRCTLLQHMSQVNILLIAVKAKHTPAKRIGFEIPTSKEDETEDK